VAKLLGLQQLLDRNTDVTLSIAYVFDFLARTARVISYIIMHILTYKHARKFEKTYRTLVSEQFSKYFLLL